STSSLSLTPISTLFPYTTLFRSQRSLAQLDVDCWLGDPIQRVVRPVQQPAATEERFVERLRPRDDLFSLVLNRADVGDCGPRNLDRKSTRLNSSHGSISYAVFCL